MKAIEYYEQYRPIFCRAIPVEQLEMHVIELFEDFNEEAYALSITRKAVKPESWRAILKEQNDKWNALVRIFQKKDGISPIKENGFQILENGRELSISKILWGTTTKEPEGILHDRDIS